MIEPQQGATYSDQLALAKAAERLGFSALFRSDHFLALNGDGMPGPTDSWVTLGALARETTTIRLGTLVTSATFRWPGPLAIAVAQVDEMSAGRIELGLGTGWFDAEHTAYGIPFPPLRERFDRLDEQLQIITGLWTTPLGQHFNFRGSHYTVADSPALPKPVQRPHPPIIVGGSGAKRTPALAARYAAEYNIPPMPLDAVAAQIGRVNDALAAVGRTSDSMTYSAMFPMCIGHDDAEVARRKDSVAQMGDFLGSSPLVGKPAEIVDRVGVWLELGVERAYAQLFDIADTDQLELLAAAVMPHLT